jgi:hypothetical protein
MSNKVISMLGALVVGLGFLAATTNGCGGGSSASSPTDVCNKLCDKEVSCGNLPTTFVAQCKASCVGGGAGSSGATSMTSCPGMSADQVISKANACLGGACSTLETCLGGICPGSTGTAGRTGTGTAGTSGSAGSVGSAGSTGAAGFTVTGTGGGAGFTITGTGGGAGFTITGGAGTAGSSCATACTKADACCAAIETDGGKDCTLKMTCDMSTDPTQTVAACNGYLQVSALLGAMQPAACK